MRSYDALLAATGFAHGHHGCETPPGPKAVINIIVPLSTFMDQGPGGGGGPARTEGGKGPPDSSG